MQQKPNEGPTWAPAWWRNRRKDLCQVDRTIVLIGSRPPYCLLCEQPVPWGVEAREQHHREHMVELDAWRLAQPPEETVNARRARRRRTQRDNEVWSAEKLGEDAYIYAVKSVDPVTRHRRRRRRRLRHPRAETEARIRDLHAQGLMRPVIADRMRVSEDYVRRVLKRLENGGGVPEFASQSLCSCSPQRT